MAAAREVLHDQKEASRQMGKGFERNGLAQSLAHLQAREKYAAKLVTQMEERFGKTN